MYKNLSVQDFFLEIQNPEIVLIDVRTKEEQKKYGIVSEDQLHIDYNNIFFSI